jgi:hypothetical protein
MLPLWSIQALGEHQNVPLVLLVLDVVDLGPCLDRNAARRCALPCRTASAAVRTAQSTPQPRLSPRLITRVTLNLPSPKPDRFDPQSIDFDELRRTPRRAAPRNKVTGEFRRRQRSLLTLTARSEINA